MGAGFCFVFDSVNFLVTGERNDQAKAMINEVKERFKNYFLRHYFVLNSGVFSFIWGLVYKFYRLEMKSS